MPSTLIYPMEWPIISKAIKDERGWQCEICHVKQGDEPNNNMTVHHKDHSPFNNDPSNLLVVCQKCHLRLEGVYKRNRRATTATAIALSEGQLIMPTFGKLLFPQPNKLSYLSPVLHVEAGK